MATLLSLAGLGRADDYLDAPRVPGTFIGVGFSDSKKNLYNCDTKWKDGLVVTGIEISGKNGPYPDSGYGWDKINWGADKIQKVRLWVNYNNGQGPNAVGRVQVWPQSADADQKKILDVGSDVGGDGGGLLVDNLGSGVLVGVLTQSGAYLETLEFVFMDGKVKSAEIINIEWPESIEDLNKKKQGIKLISVDDSWIRNSNPDHYTETTSIVGADVSISVSAGVEIPGIVKLGVTATAGAHWESQSMQSTSTTDTVTYDMQVTQSSTADEPLEPQHVMYCSVTTFSANYDTSYNAIVRTTMSTGKSFDIRQRGKLVSILFTSAIQDFHTVLINEVPAGGKLIEGTNIPGSETAKFNKPTSLVSLPAPNASTVATVVKRAFAFQA
ncbi:MAG: hypothetical protein M1829_006853 [Trizodia sp. TS-e1964]|nr:MAG: hypothetical protein M1829_006853 [Trizodia sp. TS-e1964]